MDLETNAQPWTQLRRKLPFFSYAARVMALNFIPKVVCYRKETTEKNE